MEMPVKGYNNQPVTGSNESILYSGNENLRVFQVSKRAELNPLDDAGGTWLAASTETTPDFSATAYYFGQLIQEVTGIPIGLIEASWGGSNIETWMDKATLENVPDISIPETIPEIYPQQGPGLLYNGMLHSFRNLPVKGIIWYQGESNRLKAEKYKELFPALIHSWRTGRDQPDLPVYFVQIAPFNYSAFNDPPNAAALLKEAQLHVMKTVPNTGMVVTADIGDCQNIHPPDKKEVGRRLAYWALANNYNMKGVEFSGPVYRSMEPEDGQRIRIYFDYTSNGLTSFGYDLKGFEIAGADRKFVSAQATIHADHSVSVWNNSVSEPVAVRYAFGNCVEGTLFNLAGLPASPFRTDKW
jgi:sialate O-acetylesterase